jgi:hypothetical protein
MGFDIWVLDFIRHLDFDILAARYRVRPYGEQRRRTDLRIRLGAHPT